MTDTEVEQASYEQLVAAGDLIPAKAPGNILDVEPVNLGHTPEEIEAALNWVRADRF